MNNLERFRTSTVSVADSLQAKENLKWIADRWNDLNARLVPAPAPLQGGGRPAPTSRPPLNLSISNLLHEIEVETRMMGHVLLDETPGWRPRTSSMPGLLRDVADMHGHWTTQDDQTALRFIRWATEYRGKVTTALENPPNPQYLGPCLHCLGDLYVTSRERAATCRGCGSSIDIETQMAYVQEQLQTRLMTLAEIRVALMVLDIPHNYATLRKWAERKRLVPEVGKLYRLATAMELARTAANKRAAK